MSDQTYDDGRARNLEQLLRPLADHLKLLDAEGRLLANRPSSRDGWAM